MEEVDGACVGRCDKQLRIAIAVRIGNHQRDRTEAVAWRFALKAHELGSGEAVRHGQLILLGGDDLGHAVAVEVGGEHERRRWWIGRE